MSLHISQWRRRLSALALAVAAACAASAQPPSPTPLITAGTPAEWVFVFKLNAGIFPTEADDPSRLCPFGGKPANNYAQPFSQRFLQASSVTPELQEGVGLVGTSPADPVGAMYAEIYNGSFHYVVWNDQFEGHPRIAACGENCGGTWGHAKGVLAWDDTGAGFILQVTTPNWPGTGSARRPRAGEGNSLGCISKNNVEFSQDFFALKLSEADVEQVLAALANASVGTDIGNDQIVNSGGPPAIVALVAQLGRKSKSLTPTIVTLSSGVRLISKPSRLHVPPWQLVSALLGRVDLRVATWLGTGAQTIPSTTAVTPIGCWNPAYGWSGAVESATSGRWRSQTMSLKAGPSPNGNHAKVGLSLASDTSLVIFGDMNQQGSLTNCKSSQDARGGMFFVLDNALLHASVADLLTGDTAPFAPTP